MNRMIAEVPLAERWAYRSLLLLADPEEQAVRRYLSDSDMFVLKVDGKAVCEAVVRSASPEECELMNLATLEEEQGRGYAGEMVRWLQKRYAASAKSMLVGTSEDGVGFYVRLGFRPAFVRKNFFVENYDQPIMENGRQCIDMFCLRLPLGG